MSAGDQPSYAIDIPRTGQHPYMLGDVRFSTVFIIAVWVLLGGACIVKFVPHSGQALLVAVIILCGGVGALYGLGVMVAKGNPYYQEALLRYVVRLLRRRTNLET